MRAHILFVPFFLFVLIFSCFSYLRWILFFYSVFYVHLYKSTYSFLILLVMWSVSKLEVQRYVCTVMLTTGWSPQSNPGITVVLTGSLWWEKVTDMQNLTPDTCVDATKESIFQGIFVI